MGRYDHDSAFKPLIDEISFLHASIDRLTRFRSRVCQLVCAGGEESDESILDKLRDWISNTPADKSAASLTPDQIAAVREIVHEVLDEEWQRKLDEDAGKWY